MKIKKARFEAAVREALKFLPAPLEEKIENLEIIVEDWPDEEVLEEMGLESPYDLLGLYQGVPRPARGFHYSLALPDIIFLYQKPIEDLCRNEKDLKYLIRDVLYHEIGHYYGFSDDELDHF